MPGGNLRHADTLPSLRRAEDLHKTEAESAARMGFVVHQTILCCAVLTGLHRRLADYLSNAALISSHRAVLQASVTLSLF
jgi:hypothetical protein